MFEPQTPCFQNDRLCTAMLAPRGWGTCRWAAGRSWCCPRRTATPTAGCKLTCRQRWKTIKLALTKENLGTEAACRHARTNAHLCPWRGWTGPADRPRRWRWSSTPPPRWCSGGNLEPRLSHLSPAGGAVWRHPPHRQMPWLASWPSGGAPAAAHVGCCPPAHPGGKDASDGNKENKDRKSGRRTGGQQQKKKKKKKKHPVEIWWTYRATGVPLQPLTDQRELFKKESSL